MTFDPSSANLRVGVVGAGTMGRGIAQVAVLAGAKVQISDIRSDAPAAAIATIGSDLDRLLERGKIGLDQAQAKTRLAAVGSDLSALADCDIVIEAILEDLETKRSLFARLEEHVRPDCILATNTSSLSVTAIAGACRLAERVAGLHFFNPVPVMKIVEVVPGLLTSGEVITALEAFGRRLGHAVAVTRDTPGFLINHAGRAYGTEALRIASEGIASVADIDRILTGAAGFRIGPFQLLDLIGLDVTHAVMESLYRQFYEEPRYRPAILLGQLVAAGMLGRKSGRGFYAYPNGQREVPRESDLPNVPPARIWVSRRSPPEAENLIRSLQMERVEIDSAERPAPDSACVVLPFGEDATAAAIAEHLDPVRTVAVDMLFWPGERRTLMTTPVTSKRISDGVHCALARGGTPVTVIQDSPGFVAQRVVAMIVNIACDIAQQRIARSAEIDRAVSIALGYPAGPLAWGDQIGGQRILAILEAMHAFYGDPRYRPSPWLKRRARLDVSLTAESN
jgi:3-hydroxybutyryl-CoA dehydrogenase